MTAAVRTVTHSSLKHRREELLASIGLNLADFRKIAETRSLTSEEWDISEELDQFGFLLGDETVTA
jgi:hypothetical protein